MNKLLALNLILYVFGKLNKLLTSLLLRIFLFTLKNPVRVYAREKFKSNICIVLAEAASIPTRAVEENNLKKACDEICMDTGGKKGDLKGNTTSCMCSVREKVIGTCNVSFF